MMAASEASLVATAGGDRADARRAAPPAGAPVFDPAGAPDPSLAAVDPLYRLAVRITRDAYGPWPVEVACCARCRFAFREGERVEACGEGGCPLANAESEAPPGLSGSAFASGVASGLTDPQTLGVDGKAAPLDTVALISRVAVSHDAHSHHARGGATPLNAGRAQQKPRPVDAARGQQQEDR